MKKALFLFLAIVLLAGLGSCSIRTEPRPEPRIKIIEGNRTRLSWTILKDTETGVCYLCANDGVTVMHNADGSILVDKGKE